MFFVERYNQIIVFNPTVEGNSIFTGFNPLNTCIYTVFEHSFTQLFAWIDD